MSCVKRKDIKVCICIFGVLPRSIKYIHHNIKEKLIKPLKEKFNTDIYVFNLNVEDSIIDGTKIDQEDCNLLPSDVFEERKQKDLDIEIDHLLKTHDCSMLHPQHTRNSLRCMYSESRVAFFLRKKRKKYQVAVVCSTDFWFLNTINDEEIINSVGKKKNVYTTIVNDSGGYTDSFYIGDIEPIIKVTDRYNQIKKYLPTTMDHEHILKKCFQNNGINRIVSDTGFFKVRANKSIWRSFREIFLTKLGKEFVEEEYKKALDHVKSIS